MTTSFVFLQSQSPQDENAQPNTLANNSQVITEKEKFESLKCLKVYFSEFTDAQLFEALGRASWDSDKALELLMEETFNQRNSTNQKKLTETNELY